MPSHKQKRVGKKSHKHKHRKSRSPLRKRNTPRKNEGKKENIPHNKSSVDAEKLKDFSSFMENRKEMIRQMFSAVGEDFLVKNTPTILKKVSKEELKRICYEELSKMSNDVIFKLLEGIPCDTEEVSSQAECTSSISCGGRTPAVSPEKESCKRNKGCEEPELASCKDDNVESSKGKCEVASTSCHPSLNKKLAKVAPFNISIAGPETQQPSGEENEEDFESSDTDSEATGEIVDLGLEEDIVDMENESDTLEEKSMVKAHPDISALDENTDCGEVTEEEMQQNLSEVLELEHRARAIRSMLANIDRFQA